MNWFTLCPSCGATYQVVPDQLKIAQGWLRCGQCRQAFDSTGMVLNWPDSGIETTQESAVRQDRVLIDDLLKQEDRSPLSSGAMTAVASFEEALVTFKPQPLPSVQGSALPESSAERMSSPAEPEVRKARSWGFRLGVAFLLLAFALQWLWIERHALATRDLRMGRALNAVCRFAGCEILPLQMRDGVVIESSSLTPHEGGLLFSWSVRNVTAHTLQTPALELTLLDAQDKALVRRVLLVAQQGAPRALVPDQVWSAQLHLQPEAGLLPAGYRVISFYP